MHGKTARTARSRACLSWRASPWAAALGSAVCMDKAVSQRPDGRRRCVHRCRAAASRADLALNGPVVLTPWRVLRHHLCRRPTPAPAWASARRPTALRWSRRPRSPCARTRQGRFYEFVTRRRVERWPSATPDDPSTVATTRPARFLVRRSSTPMMTSTKTACPRLSSPPI